MPFVLKDRIKETTTSTGTGTITLAGAVAGFQSFSAIGNANNTYYAIVSQTPGQWEVGIGTYTSAGTTLSRDTVLESSNAGALVNFSAGTKDVFVTYPGEVAVAASNGSGTSGQVLTSAGPNAPAAWQAVPAANPSFVSVTANYAVTSADNGKILVCTGGTFTVTLPTAASVGAGFNCWVWNQSGNAADSITIALSGSETLDGRSTRVLYRGEGVQAISEGVSFYYTGYPKAYRAFSESMGFNDTRPLATGANGVAIGFNAVAAGQISTAINGASTGATANNSFAVGRDSAGVGSSTTNTSAVAFGGGSASQVGAFAIGRGAVASGAQSHAIGPFAQASGANSFVVSTVLNASGSVASGSSAVAIGLFSTASQGNAHAIGASAVAQVSGKYAYSAGAPSNPGDSQYGLYVMRRSSGDATPGDITVGGGAASTTNCMVLPNNSAFAFSGIVVARQNAGAGTNSAAWRIEGLIRREGTAASTTLVASTVTVISNAPGWTLALSANTTVGALALTGTGAAATNIRWVATVNAAEAVF